MDQRRYEKERTCDAISNCSLALDVLAPKWQCSGGGGDYCNESLGRMFSVSVNFDSRDTQTLFLMMPKRG
jgi:hypothetical protein